MFNQKSKIVSILFVATALAGCTKGPSFGLSKDHGALVLVKHDCESTRHPMKQIEIRLLDSKGMFDHNGELIWAATSDQPAALPAKLVLAKMPSGWYVTGELPRLDEDRSMYLTVTWDNGVRSDLSIGPSLLREGFVMTWRYREQVPIEKYVASNCG